VSEEKWKMKFTIDFDGNVIENEEGEDEQLDTISCKVSIVKLDEDEYRVDFKRKGGS
jgi:hypothetical protein